jgi:hypothetical protein
MAATYSINVGQPTESFRNQDINSSLLHLPDNTNKLISPKDVRDAFLTAWASSAFKQTVGQAGIEYLGIDSGNPSNRDIKEKIFIGKRSYAGHDIMDNSLLSNSDSDIYIYNTKEDNAADQNTKIVILSGTNSSLYYHAPYIVSKVSNSEHSLTLDLINPSPYSGPINIRSDSGRVSINNIMFPTVAETTASASNGMILKYHGTYPNGSLKWSNMDVNIATIGSEDSITDIYGDPVNVNGYPLEFVEDSIVPETIGGIEIGSSFSAGSFNSQNWPLSEVIRKLLYPYVPPTLSLSISNTILTTGLTYTPLFNSSVYRYSNPIYEYEIIGTTYSGSYNGNVGTSVNDIFTQSVYSDNLNDKDFVLRVRDNLSTFSYSCTASISFVHPSFYGFSDVDVHNASSLGTFINNATRYTIQNIASQSISLTYNGNGYIYFVVPYAYDLLTMIKDPNGFIVHDSNYLTYSSFTYSSGGVIPSGANNLPSPAPSYRIYRTIGTCSYTGGGKFEFIF